MQRYDALILAGGRARPEMATKTGTDVRALFEWRGKPFVQYAFEALRASAYVDRIAIIGPPQLNDVAGLVGVDLLLAERETISENLLSGLADLNPQNRVLVTACDNPLLSTSAFDNFLNRIPVDTDIAFPILRHDSFLTRFPNATNIPIRIQDGVWIGGDCISIAASAIPALESTMEKVLGARKSMMKMALLLGIPFSLRFAMKRVTVQDVERRVTEITGVSFKFVRDSDPVFVIDIDDPEDWDYLESWARGGQ